MQSSSNELSTSVADSVKCEQTKVDTYAINSRADVESHFGLGVCHRSNVKSGEFRSQLEASRVSSHTEELCYNETVCLGTKKYIDMCVCVCVCMCVCVSAVWGNTSLYTRFYFSSKSNNNQWWLVSWLRSWKRSSCHSYRRHKGIQQPELKSWAILFEFYITPIPLGKIWIELFSLQMWVNSRVNWVL